jgi:hypothetical protein
MTAARWPATPITDRDRRRACRLAHAFGAAAAAGVALLLLIVTRFPSDPVPLPVLAGAGSALALAAGVAAYLTARPPRVVLGGGWLTVSRLGRWQRVQTGRLAGWSGNPRVAGTVVLVDEDGNRAEVDVRVLVRNPLIWQRVYQGVSRARQRGSLELAGADATLWESVVREVAEADRRALTGIDVRLPRYP